MKATQNIRIFKRSNVQVITVLRWKTLLKHHIWPTQKKCQFSSAVRGFHHYRNTWFPEESEVLYFCHVFKNSMFAIKKCKSNGQIVGHLPREISRVTKFLLDRGAVVQATLSTTHYRRSPLVQGGLEIACKVSVKMPGTIKNHLLMDRYFELVRSLYTEPKNEVFLGSFLRPVDVPYTPKSNARKKKVKAPVPAKNRSQLVIYEPCFNTWKGKTTRPTWGAPL